MHFMEGNDDLFVWSVIIEETDKAREEEKMRSELNWTMLMNNFAPSPSRCSAISVFVSYLSVHFIFFLI